MYSFAFNPAESRESTWSRQVTDIYETTAGRTGHDDGSVDTDATGDEYRNLLGDTTNMTEAEIASDVLDLPTRSWVEESIDLHQERIDLYLNEEEASLAALTNARKRADLYEQFNWLSWAIAMKYFGRTEGG